MIMLRSHRDRNKSMLSLTQDHGAGEEKSLVESSHRQVASTAWPSPHVIRSRQSDCTFSKGGSDTTPSPEGTTLSAR